MDETGLDGNLLGGGVDSPSRLATFLAICRVSNLPTVWMSVVAAAALTRADSRAGTVALLALALSAFYCAGMVLNDIFDRDWDALHQPFRPIPAGQLGLAQAWALATALIGAAFGGLLAAPHPAAVGPGAGLLGLIFVYDRFHKRFAASVFVMAATRAMVFIVTSWALVAGVQPLVLVGAAAQFLYTLLVAAVARHENVRGQPYGFPLVPRMIAGMSLLDGALLAIYVHPAWLIAGVGAACLTRIGQQFVRGD